MQEQRVIRVFVSSTFRDMKEEREELAKRVFPQLRKLCESRGVVWGEVDLRWGITDEERAEGKVLPICLEEIRSCRPYFIGMLGERYGWVPLEIPEELIEREPWLAEHKEKSVTELEIIHGVLNDPAMADRAFFYLRDPAWVKSKPKDQQAEFLEGPTEDELRHLDSQAAEQRAETRRHRLAELKERIRVSGLPVKENFRDPKHLGELVLQDLSQLIDRLFPKGSRPDLLDTDAAEHEAFAQSRFSVYIGRPEYFDRLDQHAEGNGPPFVVLGEPGSGKSALLANWAEGYQVEHPDVLFIKHFIGATPYSTDWAAMLRRIMSEFRRRFDIQGDIPSEPDELRLTFANWLHMAAAKGKAILILDALNQLEDRDGAPDLVWLPRLIPPKIRFILSTLPGRPLDDLIKRGWPTMRVEPLTTHERKQLVREYLGQYGKSLSHRRIESIVSVPQTENPLYLRTFLEELRLWGEHERLSERISFYLDAGNVPELFGKVLERYEADYERDRRGLVRDAMTTIWAARRGLTEAELLELLGDDGNPLPQAVWAPLAIAAERSLGSSAGLLGFSHDYMRQAVRNRYLPTEETEQIAHLRLADYFSLLELTPRSIDELPWQLAEAKAWQRLYDLLADLEFFEAAWARNQFDVKALWARVESGSELRIVDAFRKVVNSPDDALDSTVLMNLSILLSDTGHPEEALSLLEYLVEQSRRMRDRNTLQKCLGWHAAILRDRGDLDAAMKLLKEQQRICAELDDPKGLASSLSQQAVILRRRGDLGSAMKLHKEEERICRELGDPAGLYRSLNNQAIVLLARGDHDGAVKLLKDHERICRELGDPAGLSASLGNQAHIRYLHGDLDGAIRFLKEEERICRELGNPSGLQKSLGSQASILYIQGDLDAAMELLKEKERICRALGDPAGLNTSLNTQALILMDRGDLDAAMELLKNQERICRELETPVGLQINIGNQALILRDRGDLDGAMKLLKDQERICRELGDAVGLSYSLGNQANVLYLGGDLDGAMELHNEEERICREVGLVRELADSLRAQGKILVEQGRAEEGLGLAEEAYLLATEHRLAPLAAEIKPILDEIRSQL